MRNLKKFLALVMAMVMSFSLMLTANAASKYDQVKEWTDKDQVTEEFVEAVDVLSGMKIFQGDDRGFAPGATITRAETAALIYRLATGDVDNVRAGLYANYGNFADVNESDWFAGYVGYCANAGYIKGHGGYFNPYAPVTGYEALAMILRAVGYDKNHEFEGATWQTNVSALGTRLGVLDDVRTSDYANTLHLPSRRDVVASILFNTADTVATVTWTPALGYETQKVSLGGTTADGWNGNTLGWINFGLTDKTGIIVGNQDTGESKTIINTAVTGAPSHAEYFYDNTQYTSKTATAKVAVNTSAKIDAKTGIDMFGHKVKAWYCNSTSANGAAEGKTFALYDNVKKTALVTIPAANNPVLSNDGTPANAPLGVAAQKAGFSVDLKDSKAVFNQDFSKSGTNVDAGALMTDYNKTGTAGTSDGDPLKGGVSNTMDGETGTTAKYPLYLLISNNSDLTVDMVVAVNVEVSRVSQVNNYATYPTVTVPTLADEWNVQKDGSTVDERLLQTSLTATSTKTLGEPVVGVAIEGTKAYKPGSNAVIAVDSDVIYRNGAADGYFWRRLSKPTSTVEGTVTNFNYTGNGDNQHTGSIVIGGQRIERSLLADAIVDYNPDITELGGQTNRGILGNKAVNLSASAQLYGNYRAYLDSEGKYIWIEPIYESKFVYATYLDYTTPYGSSSYEYTLIGVDLNGEQVKQVVKTVDGQPIDRNNYNSIAPYRDSANVAGVTPLSYKGYLIDGEGNLTTITDSDKTTNKGGYFETISPQVNQAGAGSAAGRGILDNTTANAVTVTSTDARLGTKNLAVAAGTAVNAATTYFTNDTKFIVVDGAGTDTQKIEVYNGMTEFLKGGSRVTINGENTLVNATAYLDAESAPATGSDFNEQMYYTQSPLTYASVQGNPMKVDTIVLPKQAITWTGVSGLYYVGNPAQDSEIKSGKWADGTDRVFHLYTMYLDGEAQQVWLTNAPGGSTPANPATPFPGNHALVKDTFYKLYDTGLKTPMGNTVYVANNGTTTTATTAAGLAQSLNGSQRPDLANGAEPIIGNGDISKVYYEAATYSSQTAIIGTPATGVMNTQAGGNSAIFNVAGAKVVNLNAANSPASGGSRGYVWPGITDLGTLNDASSTAVVYQTNRPKVSVQVDPTNNLQVTVIYVCWDQN